MIKRKVIKQFEKYLLDDLTKDYRLSEKVATKLIKKFHPFLRKHFYWCNHWNIEYWAEDIYKEYYLKIPVD
jgi:hypothetical protein